MNTKKGDWFTQELLEWNRHLNKRSMPWKGEKDPYKIWLSEIILQQTRVEQGLGYYDRYVKKYPTIHKLAAAPENDVFKLWEGLGYYSRCKNLHATAKIISKELKGIFPDSYEHILQLKGVGPYTASAIASFAYNLPHAVVDGNVMRVLARFFGISIPIDSNEGKKYFNRLASQLLDKANPALYNQAIMDFGATICKPQIPLCQVCFLRTRCTAYKKNVVDALPVKQNRLIKKDRWFYYIVAEYKSSFFIRKRIQKDIWQNLHEFILIETGKETNTEEIFLSPQFTREINKKYKLIHISKRYRQQLTHQTIHGCFIYIKLDKKIFPEEYEAVDRSTLNQLAFPRFITNYFASEGAHLSG